MYVIRFLFYYLDNESLFMISIKRKLKWLYFNTYYFHVDPVRANFVCEQKFKKNRDCLGKLVIKKRSMLKT